MIYSLTYSISFFLSERRNIVRQKPTKPIYDHCQSCRHLQTILGLILLISLSLHCPLKYKTRDLSLLALITSVLECSLWVFSCRFTLLMHWGTQIEVVVAMFERKLTVSMPIGTLTDGLFWWTTSCVPSSAVVPHVVSLESLWKKTLYREFLNSIITMNWLCMQEMHSWQRSLTARELLPELFLVLIKCCS